MLKVLAKKQGFNIAVVLSGVLFVALTVALIGLFSESVLAHAFHGTSSGSEEVKQGLTIEVSRPNYNLLVAQATTVKGSEVKEDSWRWVRLDSADACKLESFSGTSKKSDAILSGDGWTRTLNNTDADKVYCFYVQDDKDREAVASIKILRPRVRIVLMADDKLTASVENIHDSGIEINHQEAWSWFRFKNVAGSRFGCTPEHHRLETDEALKKASEKAQSKQEDGNKHDVYNQQKDVYRQGTGNIVTVKTEDIGLRYCFQVTDRLGVTNSMSIGIDYVNQSLVNAGVIDALSPGKPDDGAGQVSAAGNEAGSSAAGDASAASNTSSDDSDQTAGSNWLRNLGFALLALALVVGIIMLVQKNRSEAQEVFADEDDDEQDLVDDKK